MFHDGLVEAIFNNDLIQNGVELTMEDEAGGIIQEGDQVDLFFSSARADRQIWTVLDVRMPKFIPMSLLVPPGGKAGGSIHLQMAGAVTPLGKFLL